MLRKSRSRRLSGIFVGAAVFLILSVGFFGSVFAASDNSRSTSGNGKQGTVPATSTSTPGTIPFTPTATSTPGTVPFTPTSTNTPGTVPFTPTNTPGTVPFTPTNTPGTVPFTPTATNTPGTVPFTPTATNTPGTVPFTPTATATPIVVAGTFVIGDQSAAVGSSVTWWGAKWAKVNSLSGGSAPNSFKGFASSVKGTPACGSTWTSSTGNSASPPATVPAQMAVIVSDSVTQSGSTISGTVREVVIVQTNSGYQNDPGHAGTGTVLSVVCHS